MKEVIKNICIKILDVSLLPISYFVLPIYKLLKKYGMFNFPLNVRAFTKVGIYPIQDHYYNPQFVYSENFDANKKRNLHLDFHIENQLASLSSLNFIEELSSFQKEGNPLSKNFYLNNPSFGPGDADLYYLIIRNLRPKKIIEIGSGFTTLISLKAIEQNKKSGEKTNLTCIEPFEFDWLTQLKDIELIRERVENISLEVFKQLDENDILFIDSSHIIRPENDVLFEYLEILPQLKKGVLIHIHDIFSPRHYRADWLTKDLRLWNEQYLLEAFLYFNDSFEIVYSLNYLKNDYFNATQKVLSNLSEQDQPGSFWIRKIK